MLTCAPLSGPFCCAAQVEEVYLKPLLAELAGQPQGRQPEAARAADEEELVAEARLQGDK